ncbi:hypothetical protein ACFE04_004971 [Oxalis oulophora]
MSYLESICFLTGYVNSDSSSPPHSRRAERIRRRKRRYDSSSPPSFESDETNVLGFLSAIGSAIRPLATTTFRYRLIRRSWRPVLIWKRKRKRKVCDSDRDGGRRRNHH